MMTPGSLWNEEPARTRFQRINQLFKLLEFVDSWGQRFFESHRGSREAVKLLAQEGR